MANEYGFKFEVNGEVFVAQFSKAGVDVLAAYNEAVKIREKIQAELLDLEWCEFTVTEPKSAARRAASAPPPHTAAQK